jgi:dihydrofolate reductase
MRVMSKRKIIVNIATSADGYIARTDGGLDWLTRRPAPKRFYGLPKFSRSVDAKIIGRKTFDLSLKMGASFNGDDVHYVFSRHPPPASGPASVRFVTESIRGFAERVRRQTGKNIWLMGGGEIIGSFLDEHAIDEFIITVVPTFIGEGIPLIAPRHREVPLGLLSLQEFPDGVFQLSIRRAATETLTRNNSCCNPASTLKTPVRHFELNGDCFANYTGKQAGLT